MIGPQGGETRIVSAKIAYYSNSWYQDKGQTVVRVTLFKTIVSGHIPALLSHGVKHSVGQHLRNLIFIPTPHACFQECRSADEPLLVRHQIIAIAAPDTLASPVAYGCT